MTRHPRLVRWVAIGLLLFSAGACADGGGRIDQQLSEAVPRESTNLFKNASLGPNETPSTLDGDFLIGAGPDDDVLALALLPDGKILMGGDFEEFDRNDWNGVARLHPNGALDLSFDPNPGPNGTVYAVAAQTNSQVLIGGEFTRVSDVAHAFLARLNADGSLDTAFNVVLDDELRAIVVQPDQRILIGGRFTNVNGVARHRVARLQANGSLDGTFDPGSGANGRVRTMLLQPDGKVLVGGDFTQFDGFDRNRIVRLLADGSVDSSFDPGAGASAQVRAIALAADGKVLIGGDFTSFAGVARSRIARLNADGSLDATFDAGNGANDSVRAIAIRPDGKMLLGGSFSVLNWRPRPSFGQLEANGAMDDFYPIWGRKGSPFNTDVFAIVPQTNGLILVAGQFHSTNGISRSHLERVYSDQAAVTFEFDAATTGVPENAGSLTVTVRRNGDSSQAASVDYATGPASLNQYPATPDGDYVPQAGTLYFAALETAKSFTISILDDYEAEPTERFSILLSNPAPGAGLGLPKQVSVAINDDDAPLNFSAGAYLTNESAGTVTLRVVRNTSLGLAATVDFFTADGTAVSGLDYVATGGRLSFAAGESSKTIEIRLLADGIVEGSEGFYVHLTNATGVGIGILHRASVEIVDASGTFMLPDNAVWVEEQASVASVQVLRSGLTIGTVSVDYTTVAVSATSGKDYTATSGTLTFRDGEVRQTVSVPLFNDGLDEATEEFRFLLSNPSTGATLGADTNRPVYIRDNDRGVEFRSAAFFAAETAPWVVLRAGRGDDGGHTATVRYSTRRGTAMPGDDYTEVLNGVLTLPPGETNLAFSIPLLADAVAEPAETFQVFLHNPDAETTLGQRTEAEAFIIDGHSPASLDGGFRVEFTRTSDPPYVWNVAVRPDGRVVFSEPFSTTVEGVYHSGPAQVLRDGALDRTFQPAPLPHNGIYSLALQPDGKLLWSSASAVPDGTPGARSLRRLLVKGDCDPTFLESCEQWFPVSGFLEGWGAVVVPLSDGNILLGGSLGAWRYEHGLERHHPDGTLDTNFLTVLPPGVTALALQADGQILAGGWSLIARLQLDGSFDPTFRNSTNIPMAYSSGPINGMVTQADGRIIIGGDFAWFLGAWRTNLARLNADGSLDETFPATADGEVRALVQQPNGRIVLGGAFTRLNGVPRNRIGRLNPDGSLDLSFDPDAGPDGEVNALALQPDGKILVGGSFGTFDGLAFAGLVRLMGDPAPVFTGWQHTPAGLRFTLDTSVPGQRIEIHASTNLIQWTPIETNTDSANPRLFVDPAAAGHQRRYYRALERYP